MTESHRDSEQEVADRLDRLQRASLASLTDLGEDEVNALASTAEQATAAKAASTVVGSESTALDSGVSGAGSPLTSLDTWNDSGRDSGRNATASRIGTESNTTGGWETDSDHSRFQLGESALDHEIKSLRSQRERANLEAQAKFFKAKYELTLAGLAAHNHGFTQSQKDLENLEPVNAKDSRRSSGAKSVDDTESNDSKAAMKRVPGVQYVAYLDYFIGKTGYGEDSNDCTEMMKRREARHKTHGFWGSECV